MTSLPFFLLLSPDGRNLTGEQAHALASLAIRRDLALTGLQRASVPLLEDEAQDIGFVFSQSEPSFIFRWCSRLVISLRNSLGNGVLYVVLRFEATTATLTVVSHCWPEKGAMLADSMEIARLACEQVKATVADVVKTQPAIGVHLQQRLVRRKLAAMVTAKKSGRGCPATGGQNGNPGDSGGEMGM